MLLLCCWNQLNVVTIGPRKNFSGLEPPKSYPARKKNGKNKSKIASKDNSVEFSSCTTVSSDGFAAENCNSYNWVCVVL